MDAIVVRPIEVTPRRVLALAVPMTLSHITTPLLGFVGAAVIGRLGDAALLGAIALGAVVFDFVFWTFGSLRMTTAGLTAQAVGASDPREIDVALHRALVLAAAVGCALVLLQRPIAAAALILSGASATVQQALSIYIAIRIFAAPFTLANYAVLGSLLGRGRTDLGLLLQVAINGVNIALTLLFVLVLGLGIAGAALASVAAELFGVLLGAVILARLGTRLRPAPGVLSDRAALVRMLSVNGDVMVRTAALMLAFALFASLGARSGDVTLAANAVLQNMFLIGGYFLDGFATAGETLCGQAVGARDEAGFRRGVRLVLVFSLGFGLALSTLFLATGGAFVDAVTTNPEVREVARRFLPYAAATPLAGAAAFAFDGIYVAATWTAAMRNLMLLAFAIYALLLLVAGPSGNQGLWIALLSFLLVRGCGQWLFYPRLTRGLFAAGA